MEIYTLFFEVEFPKKGEIKNAEQLKNILPMPKNVPAADKSKCEYLEEYDETSLNPNAEGGKQRDEDDEDDGPRGGQRVQCAQQ